MADVGDSELAVVTSVLDTDILTPTIDPDGSPATKRISVLNLFKGRTLSATMALGIRSTGAAFDLQIKSTEVLTADRALTIVLGDAARTLTIGASASISGTNTGDQTSVSGNAGTATALQNARTINGTSFDGTANITITVPIATGVSGLGANVATFLATPSSANLRAALTDENGTGAALFDGATTPSFTTGFTVGGAAASRKMIVGNGTNFVPSTETWAVPGTSGNVLTSDGTNWTSAAPAGGGGTPGGADTQVQFNDGGVFGGDSGLTFNKTSNVLSVTGGIVSVGDIALSTATGVLGIGGLTSSFAGIWTRSGSTTQLVLGLADRSGPTLFWAGSAYFNDSVGAGPGAHINGSSSGRVAVAASGIIGISNGAGADGTLDIGLTRGAPKVFRIGDGGANANGWFQWAGQARLTGDATKTNTTFANLTDLTISNLQAGRKYVGTMRVKCNNSAAAEGIKFDFNGGTATMTAFWAAASASAATAPTIGANSSTSLTGVINYTAITGETYIEFSITFVVDGAGTLIPRFAENSTVIGTVTVELGSFIMLHDSPN